MLPINIIFIISWIIIRDWINAHPQTQPWFVVSRTIVVHTCLLVQFLCVEEIRRVPCVVALLNEYFAEWNIFDMLGDFAIKGW